MVGPRPRATRVVGRSPRPLPGRTTAGSEPSPPVAGPRANPPLPAAAPGPLLAAVPAASRFPVPVVCAVIVRAGRLLLAQRPPHKLLPRKWEFAGGKVEPGEAPAVAIVREIREELGCAFVITRALPPFVHDYGTVVIEMLPFVGALAPDSPEPHPHEHMALAWVPVEELAAYDLAAADWPVVAAYAAGATAARPAE